MLRGMLSAWTFVTAFVRARWGYRFKDRAALLRWQRRRIDCYLRDTLKGAGYYAQRPQRHLAELPIVDKPQMLAAFSAFNRHQVSLEAASAVALRAEGERDFKPTLPRGISVGLSSGTSGARGIFLVSPRERALWAGVVLARTLNRASLRQLLNPVAHRLKIALCLRANSSLYTSVHGIRLKFEFCDLLRPMSEWIGQLRFYAPDILIAPASVLRSLAGAQLAGDLGICPRQVISVAEVLEHDDAELITQAWAVKPAQIYQCTEGMLGQTCPAGNIHLNEEFIHFEPEWLDPQGERFAPVITDFTRTFQIFARHRIDDVLRVDPRPCTCGKVTLRLSAIEGRRDDVLWLWSPRDGSIQPVFPDLLRQSMAVVFEGAVGDYRINQDGDTWRLHAQDNSPETLRQMATGIEQLCTRLGLDRPHLVPAPWLHPTPGAKRRRIACRKKPTDLPSAHAADGHLSLRTEPE